ncbi:hypothetical protein KUTG_00641, partial [Kutzneria sp. 744]
MTADRRRASDYPACAAPNRSTAAPSCGPGGPPVASLAMGIVHSSVVDFPPDEVFAWHRRRGAMPRLTPPWAPLRVLAEASSLRDGRAVLGLPGWLRWVAAHQPDGYDPPRRFVDELVSQPLRTVLTWRHSHEFAAEGDSATRVTDRIDTPVPQALLRPMVAYRHRQLADDLATHRWARELRPNPMTVAITGSGGLIGTQLAALLSTGGHEVIRLVRRTPRSSGERRWRPADPDPDLLAGVDAVVHLAGAPIAGRFTPSHKGRRAGQPHRAHPSARRTGRAWAAPAGGVRQRLRRRHLRRRPGRRPVDRGQSPRRRLPRRCRRRLGERRHGRRRGRRPGRHGAHRDRAVPARRQPAPVVPVVRGRTRWPAGRRRAVAGLDRHRRHDRRLPAGAGRPRPRRTGERRCAATGSQRRLHHGTGSCPASAGAAARAVVRAPPGARRGGSRRAGRRQPTGGAP